jgi:shikimate dehydrogenase|tara:strand:- start:7743 stop:8558 length:816 start_codon:yes stop_codon:yes gene_type:complete
VDKYAVIGNPIGHSKSPKIHRLFGEQLGHNISYEKLEATEGTFAMVMEEFFRSGGRGVNVTLPFKGLAYDFSDVLGAQAKSCGAVNTLSFSEDGRVYGESTDGLGLIRDLNNNNIKIEGRSVLLIGAGGTTKSILPSIIDMEPKNITLTNRTEKKAEALRDAFLHLFQIDCAPGESIDRNYDLVINTTSSQLSNTVPSVSPIAIKGADSYDVNYSWQQTLFQAWSNENGSKPALQGWGMLVEQAAESFSIWRGVCPETGAVVRRLQSEVEN